MWCVVPVAGQGKGLYPLTEDKPKALIKIYGRSIIERLLERVAPAVTNICLVVGDGDSSIRAAVGDRIYGVPVRYVAQPEPLGVAHAVLSGVLGIAVASNTAMMVEI